MFLNRDFCMEKLLAREVTIYPEKKNSKIVLKNQHQIVRKTYQGSKRLNEVDFFYYESIARI